MKAKLREEKGFTLVEVLAAIVILSIVSLILTSYFTNALSYSKSNQNKTVMANLARNALFYMEKQNFSAMKEHFEKEQPDVIGSLCKSADVCVSYQSFLNPDTLSKVLNPLINGVQYEIQISYQAELHQKMLQGKAADDSSETGKQKSEMAQYLLPVKVVVRGPGGPRGQESETVVEGYISDEKIR